MKSAPLPELTADDGTPYDIPVEGSLGLLCLGYSGLIAWRTVREEQGYDYAQHLLLPEPDAAEEE